MSVLSVRDLTVRFGSGATAFTAVDGVSLEVASSSVLGLVGESGSGKSTLARAIVGLVPPAAGQVLWDGVPVAVTGRAAKRDLRVLRRRVQFVFQDPAASLDPRMSVGDSVGEGVTAHGEIPRAGRAAEVRRLLELVRLDPGCVRLRPRQMSGGQRQRVAIARALAARPEILIADEITSALDVSVQGAVLNLLRDIQRETGVGILFISHNLAVVRYLADDIAVMNAGRLVEAGPAAEILDRPGDAYTQRLLAAVPSIRPHLPSASADVAL
ncbi:Oligopeptide transport ATP-binding protein OppF [Baekduia alba]|uniref:ABC transporter ATP-binding protein n=1 Tax=Baekduia alba TaxID=2997333 RepID=UPI0023403131|nr:ATP-binding cassette domain-containing protein [Baekduia alba]WCB95151.1 Oligopeptide transport ATP-binding protein OppF [Baekduia alba]